MKVIKGAGVTIVGVTKLYSDDAEFYDIAFDWDVFEVDWLFERLGRPRAVLEPGCGSGRMLEAFTQRGVDVGGIDVSPRMIELARERLGEDADLRVADMTDFDLGRMFDGAISPINTLLHLTPEELDASPFAETATYDGGRKGEWPLVGRDATGALLWHELRLEAG